MTQVEKIEVQMHVWMDLVQEMDKALAWNKTEGPRREAFEEVKAFCQRKAEELMNAKSLASRNHAKIQEAQA